MDHCISGCRSPSGGMACRTGRSEVGALPLGQECLTPAPASWLCWTVDRKPTLPSVEWKDCEGLRKDPDLISRMQHRGAAHRTQLEMYFCFSSSLRFVQNCVDDYFAFRLSGNTQQHQKQRIELARRASRLSNYILQCSFFFFARMSCSEQSAFHGQAADPVWFFSELLFQSVAAKKKIVAQSEKSTQSNSK